MAQAPEPEEVPSDIEEILRRQDEALELLERLRAAEPFASLEPPHLGGGRRDFRRWPTPRDVTLELHNGLEWRDVRPLDMGVGGVRLTEAPSWVQGPVPVRLTAPGLGCAVIALADIMWKDPKDGKAGLRFEFQDDEEREQWSGALIDALLAEHALK